MLYNLSASCLRLPERSLDMWHHHFRPDFQQRLKPIRAMFPSWMYIFNPRDIIFYTIYKMIQRLCYSCCMWHLFSRVLPTNRLSTQAGTHPFMHSRWQPRRMHAHHQKWSHMHSSVQLSNYFWLYLKKTGHKNGCFGVQRQNHKRATVLVPLYLSVHADPVVSCHGLERSAVGMSAFYPL